MYDTRAFYGPACDLDMRNEYEDCVQKSNKIYDNILKLVPAEIRQALKSLLNEYEDINVSVGAYCNKTLYRQGLRDGFQLAKFFND